MPSNPTDFFITELCSFPYSDPINSNISPSYVSGVTRGLKGSISRSSLRERGGRVEGGGK